MVNLAALIAVEGAREAIRGVGVKGVTAKAGGRWGLTIIGQPMLRRAASVDCCETRSRALGFTPNPSNDGLWRKEMATKEFIVNFELVAAYYRCPFAEIEALKQAARADMANAEISFALMAEEIRTDTVPFSNAPWPDEILQVVAA